MTHRNSQAFEVPDHPIFTDTHCHIHEENYAEREAAYTRARAAGVERMIVVGTDEKSSREAVAFAESHDYAWASIGIHPHEAITNRGDIEKLRHMMSAISVYSPKSDRKIEKNDFPIAGSKVTFSKQTDVAAGDFRSSNVQRLSSKIVAIGEIGLDYYYNHSPREVQIAVLEAQLQLSCDHDLPVIFHVREAFADFWPIFDNFRGLRGVVHSYTDNVSNMEQALSRGLLIGVNGIATFAKDRQDIYRAIPYEKMLLETDAPYLTPVPHRGTVNEPALLTHVATHIANLQSINLQELSRATEASAMHLFNI